MGASRPHEQPVTLERCRDPGYTPGARDVVGLLQAWEQARASVGAGTASADTASAGTTSADTASAGTASAGTTSAGTANSGVPEQDPSRRRRALDRLVVQALSRGDGGVARALRRGFESASAEQRALRLKILARLSRRQPALELGELLEAALEDPEPRVVREAVRAIGKLEPLQTGDHEARLIAIGRDAALPEQRAVVEALGRIGGVEARAWLTGLGGEDEQLARRTAQALTLIERRAERIHVASIATTRALPEPTTVRLRCRAGTEAVVAEQARARLLEPGARPEDLGLRLDGAGAVVVRWSGELRPLYRVRSAIELGLEFPLPGGESLEDRIVQALTAPSLVAAVSAWTEGPPRFRLAFGRGGHRRALVWAVAQRLSASSCPLRNDSREATWTVEIDQPGARVLCLPRGADERFAYRQGDVPAASHPTLAALLAWVGRPRPGEAVWDPFCGSGTELVECARLAPGLHLHGSDLDPRAIATAKTNLAAARIEAASLTLGPGNARTAAPAPGARPISLILTNPPMGRRVARDGSLRRQLEGFVARAAEVLDRTGRLVWLSPLPSATAAAGRRAGLRVEDREAIDMGGFEATLQIMHGRATRASARR